MLLYVHTETIRTIKDREPTSTCTQLLSSKSHTVSNTPSVQVYTTHTLVNITACWLPVS